jgi:hypothetical protein
MSKRKIVREGKLTKSHRSPLQGCLDLDEGEASWKILDRLENEWSGQLMEFDDRYGEGEDISTEDLKRVNAILRGVMIQCSAVHDEFERRLQEA